MSRLFELREWLTLGEAASYLGRKLSEQVSEPEIFRLALDHVLGVSVHFVNQALARTGVLPNGEFIVDDAGHLELGWSHDKPEVIGGVWDLVVAAGSGSIELEKAYQRLVGGPEVELFVPSGLYLARPDRSEWAQLVTMRIRDAKVYSEMESQGLPVVYLDRDYPPLRELPVDATFVVRTAELDAFVREMLGSTPAESSSADSAPPIEERSRPAWSRSREQDEAILRKLRELGFNPEALPTPPAGKASPSKKAAFEALSYTPAVFDHAWKRLRADGRLKDV